MLYMVIETYLDAAAVYARFRKRGRMMPDGLEYVDSWVEPDATRCFQLMRCDDPELMREWISHWEDIVRFEVIPVVTSAEMSARMAE
jgi:hypothetical protein